MVPGRNRTHPGRDICCFPGSRTVSGRTFEISCAFRRAPSHDHHASFGRSQQLPLGAVALESGDPLVGERDVLPRRVLQERDDQHGEAPGHGDLRLLPGDAAPARADAQALELQVRVLCALLHHDVRAFDQDAAHEGVARLGRAELRVALAGLGLPRRHAEVGPHVACAREPAGGAVDRGDHRRGADDADAVDLHGALDHRLELGLPGEFADQGVVRGDLQVDRLDGVHHRPHRALEVVGQAGHVQRVEPLGRDVGQPEAHRLGEAAHLADRRRAHAHEKPPRLVEPQHPLALLAAQAHGTEERGVGERQAGELARVVPVGLGRRVAHELHLRGVGDDRPEPERLEEPLHPTAVRARLEHDRPRPVELRGGFGEAVLRRGARRLHDDPPASVRRSRHHADFRGSVAHVDADCGRIFHVSSFLFGLFVFAPPRGRVRCNRNDTK